MYFASSFHIVYRIILPFSVCDGLIKQGLVKEGFFEAEILSSLLVVVWTTQTAAASGRVELGVGECERDEVW